MLAVASTWTVGAGALVVRRCTLFWLGCVLGCVGTLAATLVLGAADWTSLVFARWTGDVVACTLESCSEGVALGDGETFAATAEV